MRPLTLNLVTTLLVVWSAMVGMYLQLLPATLWLNLACLATGMLMTVFVIRGTEPADTRPALLSIALNVVAVAVVQALMGWMIWWVAAVLAIAYVLLALRVLASVTEKKQASLDVLEAMQVASAKAQRNTVNAFTRTAVTDLVTTVVSDAAFDPVDAHVEDATGRPAFKNEGVAKAQSAAQQEPAVQIQNRAVRSNTTLDDLAGMTDLKTSLLDAGKRIASGGERNGILLFGLPGNGKTHLAEALAGSLRLPIISVSFGDIASMWVNQSTERLVQVFADAKAQAPCLLFLDEVESVATDRSKVSQSDSEKVTTTNTLLTKLVELRGSGVVIMAATNYLDRLDSAVAREGRFDFKINVPAPDQAAREAIFSKAYAATVKSARVKAPAIDGDVLTKMCRRWAGFSAARIKAIAQEFVEGCANRPALLMSSDAMRAALKRIQARECILPENTMALDDMSFNPEHRDEINLLRDRMVNIEQIEEFGGRIPPGVLLLGDPGVGKTAFSMALAKTTGWNYLATLGAELISNPDKVDELLRKASDLRPCIVFIDEAEGAFRDRSYSGNPEVSNKLLSALDGSKGRTPDVIFLAATNHPDQFDAAALRGGRLEEQLHFPLPDAGVRMELLKKWQSNSKIRFADEFDAVAIVDALEGLSPANIRSALQKCTDRVASRRIKDAKTVIATNDVINVIGRHCRA